MLKIIVGSKNAAKVLAVQQGAAAYWPDATVTGEDVPSGVAAQPIGMEETMRGALNRARAARALDAHLGVGLEGGVGEFHGGWVMFSFVAVTDGEREIAVPVTGTPLPTSWGTALKNGAELRPFVLAAGLPYDYKTGVNGLLTKNVVSRDTMFAEAVKCALAPWVNPAAFAEREDALAA